VFLSRIASDGAYLSPNVCFVDPPEEPDVDDQPEADADEGADEGDADEGDGADGDDGEGAADDAEADAGDEASGDAGEEVEQKPAAKKASDVIREQKKARKDAAQRAEEAGRKADEAIRRAEAAERRAEEAERAAAVRRQQESQEAEAARVELMSESEKIAYYRQQDRQASDARFNQLQFQQWDSTDRMEFRQLVKDDPLVAKVRDKVEVEYERLRAAGRPVSREILANQEIAKMVREGRTQAGTKQRDRAAANVRRQTVKPPANRSGATSQRTRRGEEDPKAARAERLKDVIL
jgi:hypothetical protein